MRKLIFTAAIAAIAIPASSYAQDEHRNADRQDQAAVNGQNAQSEQRAKRDAHAQPAQNLNRSAQNENRAAQNDRTAQSEARPVQNQARTAQNEARPAQNQTRTAQIDNRNAGRGDLRNGADEHRGNTGGDRHFSYQGRQFAAVRTQRFQYPQGWQYREWSVGQLLPTLFLAQPYYFDYQTIGLPPPPRGERWVRFGPDALLINIRTRRIVDVIHNVFYT